MASQSVQVAPSLSLLAAAKAHFTLGISEGQSLRGAHSMRLFGVIKHQSCGLYLESFRVRTSSLSKLRILSPHLGSFACGK